MHAAAPRPPAARCAQSAALFAMSARFSARAYVYSTRCVSLFYASTGRVCSVDCPSFFFCCCERCLERVGSLFGCVNLVGDVSLERGRRLFFSVYL